MDTNPRIPRKLARLLVVGLASLTFFAVAAPAEAIMPNERDVVWRINHEHYKHRIRSLAVWESLVGGARDHSCAMAKAQRLYHSSNLPKKYRGWRLIGENVAMGYDLYQIHLAWMRSPAHRDNILERRYRAVGAGICRDRSGAYWVTTHFYG